MRFKHGEINQGPVHCENGDLVKLSYIDIEGEHGIHEEKIHSRRVLTHWLFLSLDDGGFGVFMGTDALLGWVQTNFPNAQQVAGDIPLLD